MQDKQRAMRMQNPKSGDGCGAKKSEAAPAAAERGRTYAHKKGLFLKRKELRIYPLALSLVKRKEKKKKRYT